MAGGGVAHMAAGGMASGGTATTSNADLVNQAYANIGRTGVGTNPHQIDQSGSDYWLNQLNSGAVTPADLSKTFGGSVNAYINQSPSDPVSQVAENAMVNQAYANIGRTGVGTAPNQIDAAGQQYWLNQLQTGAVTPQDFANTFTGAATQYVAQNPTDPVSTYVAPQLAQQVMDQTRQKAQILAQTPGSRPTSTDSQFYQPVYKPQYNNMTTTNPMGVSQYGTQMTPQSLVDSSYAGIGRYGAGNNPNQVDPAGRKYWMDQLQSGAIAPNDFAGKFNDMAQQYIAMNPNDPVSKYAQNQPGYAGGYQGYAGSTGVGGSAGIPQMQTPFSPRGPDTDSAMQAAAQQVMPVTPQNFASITGTRTGKLRPDQIPAKAAAGGIASLLRAK